jgi:hypothetical protein
VVHADGGGVDLAADGGGVDLAPGSLSPTGNPLLFLSRIRCPWIRRLRPASLVRTQRIRLGCSGSSVSDPRLRRGCNRSSSGRPDADSAHGPLSSWGGGSTWMGSSGLSTCFPFVVFLFDLPRWASNRLRKGSINRNLSTEAVAMPASVNHFCSSQ